MKDGRQIPFHRPALRGRELAYVREAIDGGAISSGGSFARRCEELLQARLGAPRILLTNSATAALEMAALLSVEPGDEVILPSFTYATTASAFVRCGARLVFADISRETLNIDPVAVAAAVTPRTRVIVAVHYAGAGCELKALMEIAGKANVALIEDAAQAFDGRYDGRPLGTFGKLAALSFNWQKNVTSGEGGALIINDARLTDRAEIVLDRGTNRPQFLRGQVPEYSWTDIGSAYAPSEIIAAFLLAQLEEADAITAERRRLWTRYHAAFGNAERQGRVRRQVVSAAAEPNGHIYYLLAPDAAARQSLIAALAQHGVDARAHFVALHTSQPGRKFGRTCGSLTNTEDVARRIVRLPLYAGMAESEQNAVIEAVLQCLTR